MDAALRTALISSCQEAVIRFFAALDGGRQEEVANAFAEDGIWHRQGAALRGPAGVSKALAARPAGRVTVIAVLFQPSSGRWSGRNRVAAAGSMVGGNE